MIEKKYIYYSPELNEITTYFAPLVKIICYRTDKKCSVSDMLSHDSYTKHDFYYIGEL
jgi:hypothetical protein